jgi:hypothetical protein
MDFIERILGVSPDGGSGATEAVLVIVVAVIAGLLAWRRFGRVTRA